MVTRLISLTLAALFFGATSYATKPDQPKKSFDPTVYDSQHRAFDAELKKYVTLTKTNSVVNYKAWKKDQKVLKQYIKALSGVSKKAFKSWPEKEQLAFLINAYNANAIQLILDNYPVKSIRKIAGLFSSTFKMDFLYLFGKKRSLAWIEHENVRKDYLAPRTHFAINCASIGCPRLLNEAYTAEKWEQQLELQANAFMKDTNRNYINKKKKEVHISKIYDWFDEDFEKKSGSVLKFVLPYMTDDKALIQKIIKEDWDIEYTKYDWGLNE